MKNNLEPNCNFDEKNPQYPEELFGFLDQGKDDQFDDMMKDFSNFSSKLMDREDVNDYTIEVRHVQSNKQQRQQGKPKNASFQHNHNNLQINDANKQKMGLDSPSLLDPTQPYKEQHIPAQKTDQELQQSMKSIDALYGQLMKSKPRLEQLPQQQKRRPSYDLYDLEENQNQSQYSQYIPPNLQMRNYQYPDIKQYPMQQQSVQYVQQSPTIVQMGNNTYMPSMQVQHVNGIVVQQGFPVRFNDNANMNIGSQFQLINPSSNQPSISKQYNYPKVTSVVQEIQMSNLNNMNMNNNMNNVNMNATTINQPQQLSFLQPSTYMQMQQLNMQPSSQVQQLNRNIQVVNQPIVVPVTYAMTNNGLVMQQQQQQNMSFPLVNTPIIVYPNPSNINVNNRTVASKQYDTALLNLDTSPVSTVTMSVSEIELSEKIPLQNKNVQQSNFDHKKAKEQSQNQIEL